ncbi:MAG: alpha/beta hydrolase [Alphaproteobacteria bacterium]|nr:alpha/beta hydrolase [Alphaproteobacteria bacterium]
MRIEDYPPQEPLSSDAARSYHAEVLKRGAGIPLEEEAYGADPYQRIAMVSPPKRKSDGRVLAVIHGGGWTSGYKEWMAFMAPPFVAAGVVFASIGYRLAPQHVFPSGFEDVLAAVAWLHKNAARFGGDPARLFVGGHSAGGHYAALAAVRLDWQARYRVPANVIRGALPLSGVYDFTAGAGLSVRPRFLGPEGNGFEMEASPIRHIGMAPPPFLIAYGDDDFPHLRRQADAMETALKKAGSLVEKIVFEGRNHFTAHYAGGEPQGPWVNRALAFTAAAP